MKSKFRSALTLVFATLTAQAAGAATIDFENVVMVN